ncbi:hypothetical protein BC830DRAFT_1133679 [Chytriomyces sp. MP71]|nr:hypothetical protein BC830DRAFT_1133679 [Chytriomyces sp. MP71]
MSAVRTAMDVPCCTPPFSYSRTKPAASPMSIRNLVDDCGEDLEREQQFITIPASPTHSLYPRESLTPPSTPASMYTVSLPPSPVYAHIPLSHSHLNHSMRYSPYIISLPYKATVRGAPSIASSASPIPDEQLTHRCPHCPAKFRTRHYLESHSAVHMKERPFVCELGNNCKASFRRISDLRRHCKSVKH